MAILAVLLMLAVCIVPFDDSENGLDAAVGDGGSYEYRIVYDSSAMSSGSAAISVADMTAISHTSTTALESLNAGSWTWDTTTGYGPFNSFYAAFDLTNGNAFYKILKPNDLTTTIDGESLSPLTNYNIMWVLPTVYWSTTTTTTTDDTLILSNDSSKGTAYAHTINGHVYNYIAIGVYEGSTTPVDGQTVLTSTSGTNPTVSQTRATFRTYAHNYTMDESLGDDAYSMLWNFYQWELYKYCSYALMENFNSQATVGGGHTYGSTYVWQTGSLNTYGPYAGYAMIGTANATNGGSSAKLFIENAWGAVSEFVDGIMFHYNSAGNVTAYIDTNATPTDATATGTNIESKTFTTLSSSDFPGAISTDAQIWGYGTASGGSATNGLTDRTYVSSSGDKVLFVGGYSSTDASYSAGYGLSYATANYDTSSSGSNIGSRLAFVFDAVPAAPTTIDVDFNISDNGYGTLGDGAQTGQTTISLSGVIAGAITIDDSAKTFSIGSHTITATPTAADDHWTYAFDGWYAGQTKLLNGEVLSDDSVITAKFSRTLTLHTAYVESNNIAYGTVDVGQLNGIPYGETFTVSGSTLSIYNLSVVALTTTDTVRYEYSFDGFQTEGVPITTGMAMTSDMNIRAIFSCEELVYTVIVQSNDVSYGTVSNAGSYSGIPGGSTFTVNGATMQLTPADGTPISFTASAASQDDQYTYAFSGWYDALTGGNEIETDDEVTSNMTVYAIFTPTIRQYAVSAVSNDDSLGSVSPSTASNVPYGTVATISGDTVTVNGTPIKATPETATPSTTYSFVEWRVNDTPVTTSYTIRGATTFTAVFTEGEAYYQVNFISNNGEYGSVAPTFLGAVAYGTIITATGNVLDVNGVQIVATPVSDSAQYDAEFDNWTVGQDVVSSYTVTGNITVTANFTATVKSYTVTWKIGDTIETQTYEYGQMPTHADPEAPEGQEFKRWQPHITEVTGDATYTAVFDKPHSTNDSLLGMIPLLIVIALVLAAAGGMMLSNGDPMTIIKIVIGVTIGIILLVAFVIPVIGGL